MNITDFKAANPDYKDVPDLELADALHAKYYADMPRDQFLQQVGVAAPAQASFGTGMPRDAYQQQFLANNPQADQNALDMAMAGYDKDAALRAQAKVSAPADRFKALQSPEAMFNARLNAKLQALNHGVAQALPGNQQPANVPLPKPAPSTFDTLAGNVSGGLMSGLAGAGAAGASLVGADDEARELDAVRTAIAQRQQQDLGGDTIPGRAASLVGGILPALAAPEELVPQLIQNAGLFAVPAFRDTYNAKIAQGQSKALAFAHAAEAAGINLAAPTVAARGMGALAGKLGTDGLQGLGGAAAQLGQAGLEGAGFSAASTALDKGTDLIAGQQNDNAWIDPKDIAAQALGFGALRGAHAAPMVADAALDKVAPSFQIGRALNGDVSAGEFDPASADAIARYRMGADRADPNAITPQQSVRQAGDIGPSPMQRTAPVTPVISPAAPVADIAQAQNVDQAIAAATAAVPSINPEALRAGNDTNVAAILQSIRPLEAPSIAPTGEANEPAPSPALPPVDGLGRGAGDAGAGLPGLGAATGPAGPDGGVQPASPEGVPAADGTGVPGADRPADAQPALTQPASLPSKLELARQKIARQEEAVQQALDNIERRRAAKDQAAQQQAPDEPAEPPVRAADAGTPIDDGWHSFPPNAGGLDIPRADMPQIAAEHRGALTQFLAARGITHEPAAEVAPESLKPTQREFSPEKVDAAHAYQGGERSILVSSDNHVLDGHHQWLAKLENGEPVQVIRLNAPIADLIDHVREFPSATTADGAAREVPPELARGAEILAAQKVAPAHGELRVVDPSTLAGAERTVTPEHAAFVQALGKALGKTVHFFTQEGGTRRIDGMAPSAHPDDLFVNVAKGDAAWHVVAGHEFFHQMPEHIRAAFIEAIRPLIKPGEFGALKKYVNQPHLDEAGHWEEVAADLFGNRFAEPEFLSKALDNLPDRGMVAKVAAYLRDFISKLTGLPGKQFASDRYVADLDQIRAAAHDALGRYLANEPAPMSAKARREQAIADLANRSTKELRLIADGHPRAYLRDAAAAELQARAEATASKRSAAMKARLQREARIDPERDHMLQAIVKLGGINRDSAQGRMRLAPEELGVKANVGNLARHVFVKDGGMRIEDAGAAMADLGYVEHDQHGKHDQADWEDKLARAANGDEVYTPQGIMAKAEAMRAREMEQVGADSPEEFGRIEHYADMLEDWADERGIDLSHLEALYPDAQLLDEKDIHENPGQEPEGGARQEVAGGAGEAAREGAADAGAAPAFALEGHDRADLTAKDVRANDRSVADRELADRERDAFSLSAPEGSVTGEAKAMANSRQQPMFSKARSAEMKSLKDEAVKAHDLLSNASGGNYIERADRSYKAKQDLVNALVDAPVANFALQGTTRDGRMMLLNASAQRDGHWQLTRFDRNGEPWGDTQYPSKAQAIKDFLSDIDLKTLNDFDGSMKFSAKREEDRNLIVQHNLTATNLLHADKMGGLPVPSLAVTHKDRPLEGFGDISLIGSRHMIDPKGYAKTKVYGADIYSPRYPNVEHHIDQSAKRKFDAKFAEMERRTGTRLPDTQDLERNGLQEIERSLPVLAQFVKEHGIEPEIVTRKGSLDAARIERLKQYGLGDYLDKTSIFDLTEDPEFVRRAAKEVADSYRATGDEHMIRMADKLEADPERQKNLARDLGYKIIADAKERLRPEADKYATKSAVEKQITDAGLTEEFQHYAADQLAAMSKGERIFQGFTNSGNRRYIPHTLENVVKILKKELRGGENWNYGVGSVRAHFTPQFRSVKAIQEARGRLVSKEQFEKVKDEIGKEFDAVGDALAPFHPASKSFGFGDTVSMTMQDAAKMGIPRALRENGFQDVPPEVQGEMRDFLDKLAHLPTEYFEAKIERPVALSEFSGAVVPKTAGRVVRDRLEKHGLAVADYNPDDPADRARAVRELAEQMHDKRGDILFSNERDDRTIEVDGVRRPITNSKGQLVGQDFASQKAFWKWFGDSKAVDEQGRPLVVYHGTPSDFDRFDTASSKDGRGAIFVTADPEFAAKYAGGAWTMEVENGAPNVMPLYVRAEHPFDFDNAAHRAAVLDAAFSDGAKLAKNGAGEQTIAMDGKPSLYSREVLDEGLKAEGNWNTLEQEWMQSAIKKAGFDGFYVSEEGRKNLAVFDPSQIKSATGNSGTFDPDSPNMLLSADRVDDDAQSRLSKLIGWPKTALRSAASEVRQLVVPMSDGAEAARAFAKDFANNTRRAESQWIAFDKVLTKHYTTAQLEKMWRAADEENDLRRDGKTSRTKGLASLDAGERATVELLHQYGDQLWQKAKDAGMVEGDGVAYWTPRVAARIVADGDVETLRPAGGEFSKEARNLTTSASSAKHRKYDTTAESEAALQAKHGEDAAYIKNIRVMPRAMAQLEKAIAGRTLVNQIKAHGQVMGEELFADNGSKNFVTLDHPALKRWQPKLDWAPADPDELARRQLEVKSDGVYKDGERLANYRVKDGQVEKFRAVVDETGKPVMVAHPLFVRRDFYGPLKAVFAKEPNKVYQGMMQLKGAVTSLIMVSPLTHNLVIWGKALPTMTATMGWKNNLKNAASLGLRPYFVGNEARGNHALMNELIEGGLVPVSGRGMNPDLPAIARGIEPGRSLTAQIVGRLFDVASDKAGDAARRGIDKAGEFWHERLLWDRVADMQAGMAVMMRQSLLDHGVDQYAATRIATHFANRYAGMIPREAMSQGAHVLTNLSLFSKSFTLTNLGAYKDLIGGLPRDVQAQIKMHAMEVQRALGKDDRAAEQEGNRALSKAQSLTRRKGAMVLVLDVAAMAMVNSIVQSLAQKEGWGDIAQGFGERLGKLKDKLAEHPWQVISHPLDSLGSLSATAANPHGKEDRVRIGEDEAGNSYYMRLPVGKVGEEMKSYGNLITGLHLLHNKMSTFLRPIADMTQNEDFTGRRIVNPDDPAIKQVAKFGAYWVKSQLPLDYLAAGAHLVKGDADRMDKALLMGTATGLSVSKLSGGDAVAEIRYQSREQQARLRDVLPDAREALRRGDEDKARELLEGAGETPREINNLIRQMDNPGRVSRASLRKFEQHASDEDKAKMEAIRNRE